MSSANTVSLPSAMSHSGLAESPMSLQVAKFGGTSMGTVAAMEQAARVVTACEEIRFVVVSATSGTTNQLLQGYHQAVSGAQAAVLDLTGAIAHRHREMAVALGLDADGRRALEDILLEIDARLGAVERQSDQDLDSILPLGERLSSVLFAQALRNAGRKAWAVDARELLRTDSRFGQAEPLLAETRELCHRVALPLLEEGITLVTQGFTGRDERGHTTTLGRGGSDYSAALFSEAFGSSACLIWTDVDGIYSMDPRVVPEAKVIPAISFSEAAELANFGAKVLHPATLHPAIRAGIRVFVGNTFAPEKGGTWIYPEHPERPLVRAIAVRERQTLITVTSLKMVNVHGFLARLFSVLASHRLSVDLVTTSEVSVALTVDGAATGSSGRSIQEDQALMRDLREIAEVQVEDDLSLVAVIGNNLSSTPGVAGCAFQAVGGSENVRLICHGASPHNLCFLVGSSKAKAVAARLHEAFLRAGPREAGAREFSAQEARPL
jgi:aspartate kinase